jgi:hypothetical protein
MKKRRQLSFETCSNFAYTIVIGWPFVRHHDSIERRGLGGCTDWYRFAPTVNSVVCHRNLKVLNKKDESLALNDII